ncbi:hypothetical protein QBC34DRAFT_390971 [Podospora aff. communis PSN243]|uniref:DOMON domain-containing protein n=1 Tax=Podospora aff. communis PSN243 TaxID=3040156 RepID=A0AAV9H2E2_9PEZI|nr:hypothetical protein QBC34DRAFT_390971 [Podospora aff. communis PSN243]
MRSPLSVATLLSPLFALRSVLAEPVQYCRPGYHQGEADFCMGISTTVNASTKATDVYISMTVTRSSALGWTAIGTGSEMAGSTMFVVYGDPASGADPVLSIRTIDGHHQPKAVDLSTLPGLRILRSKWQKLTVASLKGRHEDDPHYPIVPTSPASHIADIAIACYACPLQAWKLDATSKSQPFIWAWNDRQEFASYPVDAHLKMHRHHSGSGGFGNFYIDMPRTLSESPEPPTIRQGAANFGTSDPPTGFSGFLLSLRARPLPKAHGFLMGAAFLLLFPLGVVLMRTPSGNPFKRHWVVQAAATGLTWLGAVVAAVMTGGRMPRTFHQWIGAAIALTLEFQFVLGWRHHMVFLRVRHRTWVSHAHIWIGRAVLGAGWVNVLIGLALSGYGGFSVAAVGALVVVEAVGVGLWVWIAQQRAKGKTAGQTEAHALMPTGGEGTEDYFAIEMRDDEFDTDGEDDKGRRSELKRSLELREIKS